MDTSSSLSIAKVGVEYHDPSGAFPLISEQLQSYLPLRNLNWKSPKRPLRSIEALHVELIKSTDGASTGPDSRPVSVQSQAGFAAPGPVKERRHQIPGLRQTPYLKLYLLRCEDSDAYKSSARKAVREWLKTHTPPSQSSSKKGSPQDNHDAFEWMILHIVPPETNAPIASPGPGGRPESQERSKHSKNASSVLEKLKSDFNVSSKSAPDRISQIRLGVKPGHPNYELKEDWDDLILKIKALILASFSQRVGQYEDDIREKEAQRALPGWNFCTFFVLKEGLARGFESVGLIDDALAGYEELDVGLDAVLNVDEASGSAMSLEPTTEELRTLYKAAQDAADTSDSAEIPATDIWGPQKLPISATRKKFRELIMSNSISLFDFKCYILARKISVLLRMSRGIREGRENLIPLGQLCQLASSSIYDISRVMREDLTEIAKDGWSGDKSMVIDNMVSSWIYAATEQILDETRSAFLAQATPTDAQFSSLLKEKTSSYPSRKSSLSPSIERAADDAHALFDRLKAKASETDKASQNKTGKDYLALQRAQLILLQRRIIESLAISQKTCVGWAKPKDQKSFAVMQEVSLGEEAEEEDEEDRETSPTLPMSPEIPTPIGLSHPTLLYASQSKKNMRRTFESLTQEALDLYFSAGQSKSFERMLSDLAMLKFQAGDYAGAANYFSKIIPVFAQLQWSLVETEMLLVHAECLKMLNRKDDYVRMLLGLLAKAISNKKSASLHNATMDHLNIESFEIRGNTLLSELTANAATLPYEVCVPMDNYFQSVAIDPQIQFLANKEGFSLKIKFKSLFEDPIIITQAKVVLVSNDHHMTRELTLESNEQIEVHKGMTTVTVNCNSNICALYAVHQLSVASSKIKFVYEPTLDDSGITSQSLKLLKASRVLCYPRNEALLISITSSRTVHIDNGQFLEILVQNGPQDIHKAQLQLKAASSGLRLHIAGATVVSGDGKIETTSNSGNINITGLAAGASMKIKLPYELDDNHRYISIKVELTSSSPTLDYFRVEMVKVELPLDVTVHDLFKSSHIFQRFHIKSANDTPLIISKVDLRGTEAFEATAPIQVEMPIVVYPRQPATLMHKISPTGNDTLQRQVAGKEEPLNLAVDYKCLDEVVHNLIAEKFVSALETSAFASLSRLLRRLLKFQLRDIISAQHLVELSLLGEVQVPSFEKFGWAQIASDLGPSYEHDLTNWLQEWHASNSSHPFPSTQASLEGSEGQSDELLRTLIISVPLPRLQVLFTAILQFQGQKSPTLSVGAPTLTTVSLEHTGRWDSPIPKKGTKDISTPMEFMYDVDGPPDTWVIGGQRRGRFYAEEGETKTWDIVLIPLRTGKLLLPHVEVTIVGKDHEGMTCETDFKGAGKTVLVLGDLRKTTVAMVGTQATLVSAER